jgi:hypothetical protein
MVRHFEVLLAETEAYSLHLNTGYSAEVEELGGTGENAQCACHFLYMPGFNLLMFWERGVCQLTKADDPKVCFQGDRVPWSAMI